MRRPMARLAWAFNERILEALAASGAAGLTQDWSCPPDDPAVRHITNRHAAPKDADADAALDAAESGGEAKRAL
jgi:hypothetical protein